MGSLASDNAFTAFRDKVVVLTGGAQGIGASTVTLLYRAGAHVFYGDWNHEKNIKLQESLVSEKVSDAGSLYPYKVDVRDYAAQLKMFQDALSSFNRVDSAIYIAGVGEPTQWFEESDLSLENVQVVPLPLKDVVDINLTGAIYFARIALAYLKHNAPSQGTHSLSMVASVAGFKESPGLVAYSASKHGVIGLMRALRPLSLTRDRVRVNAICPWATDTQMLAGVKDAWVKNQMPLNTPEDLARIILKVSSDESAHGQAVYVAGGQGYDIEEGINRLEPLWLGEENSRTLNIGQEILGSAYFKELADHDL